MKLTFLLPGWSFQPGGGARVVYQHANGLVERGHEVTIVHPARLRNSEGRVRWIKEFGHSMLRRVRPPPGRIDWMDVHPDVNLVHVPSLAPRHVPEGDAVIATAWETAEELARYPAGKGEPFYLLQHYEDWAGPRPRVDATWKAPLHKIAIAGWLIEKGRELGADDIAYVPNALDHDVFRVHSPPEDRPLRVAMMASDLPWKGTREGIQALCAVREEIPELGAVLYGPRPRPQELPAWITYTRRPSNAALVREVYNKSAAFLCPSWTEGWGLPASEAMACGCAVVSTDNGGVRDYARHGETALLSPPGDPDALAENLVRVLRDRDLRLRLSHAGRREISRFRWDTSTALLEATLMKHTGAPTGRHGGRRTVP